MENKLDIILKDNFITNTSLLYDFIINDIDFDKSMKSRWTASFGKSYDYNGMTYPAIDFPSIFNELLNEITNTVGFKPNNCLINLYHDGNSTMGYHSDNIEILTAGTGVAIVSIGSERVLRFKNKINKENIIDCVLGDGSLFYMDDKIQNEWLHSIPKSNTQDIRISLTFRNIK